MTSIKATFLLTGSQFVPSELRAKLGDQFKMTDCALPESSVCQGKAYLNIEEDCSETIEDEDRRQQRSWEIFSELISKVHQAHDIIKNAHVENICLEGDMFDDGMFSSQFDPEDFRKLGEINASLSLTCWHFGDCENDIEEKNDAPPISSVHTQFHLWGDDFFRLELEDKLGTLLTLKAPWTRKGFAPDYESVNIEMRKDLKTWQMVSELISQVHQYHGIIKNALVDNINLKCDIYVNGPIQVKLNSKDLKKLGEMKASFLLDCWQSHH